MELTMRTLVEGFPHDWQIDIVQRSRLAPVYWVANDIGNRRLLPEGVIFHRSEDAMRGIPPVELQDVEVELISDEYFYRNCGLVDTIVRMPYIRQDQFGKFLPTYSHRRRYLYQLVSYQWRYSNDR